jgi:hypothetical protein
MSAAHETGSESSSGYEDGLGRRVLEFDRESGEIRERLRLRPELRVYVKALRERLPLVAGLEDERFAHPRLVATDSDGRVSVTSEYLGGRRLSDILDAAADQGIVAGLDAGLGLLLELLPALSRLHDAGLAHGAIAPGRIMVTSAGQIVLLDALYAEALERLQLTRKRLWIELRLAFPSTAGAPRFDKAADLTQAVLSAAALIVGRPLGDNEYPEGLARLRQEVVGIASIRTTKAFAESLDRFIATALPLPTRKTAMTSADEAAIDLRKLLRKEVGITTCRNAMVEFFRLVDTAEKERAAAAEVHQARRESERLEAERLETQRAEQARIEFERVAREEAGRRVREEAERLAREEMERQARDAVERKAREEAARKEAERKARAEAERKAREEVERQIREEAERRAREEAGRREVERKARDEAERKARVEAERKAREEAERKVREEAARKEADRRAREEAERKAREEAARKEAERKAREEAQRRAREEAAREEAERKAREEAERKAREEATRNEAERKAREQAERKAREEAERKARAEAERKAREEAERKAREEAERKAREEAERKERERLEAERKAREEAERRAREEAERKERERLEAERVQRERNERERRERAAAEERARIEAEAREREARERKEKAAREREAATQAPSKTGWLVPPDRAAKFEPVAPQPPSAPATGMSAYPVYVPPAESQSWTPDVEPPPIIKLAPAAAPRPASIKLQGGSLPPLIRLKDDPAQPPAGPSRAESRNEPEQMSAAAAAYEPFTLPEEPRPMLWKIIAGAAAVLIIGVVALTEGFLPFGGSTKTDHKPPVEAKKEPPPAAPAGSGSGGQLAVTTEPDGARVLLDGKFVGASPLTLEAITPGRHWLTVQASGGSIKRAIRIEPGKTLTVDVPVYSGFASISAPFIVDVAENGRTLGTSADQIILSAGHHQLNLSNADLNYSATQGVDVEPGEAARVKIDPRGRANINAVPWAEVYIDGEKAGETPLANVPIRLGVREILFKNPQFPDRKVVTTIKAGEPATLTVDFAKDKLE